MESPICVVDAETFTDRIHAIKRWIYSDQLRLVVPSTTYENVEQQYQKSKETKSTPKEAPRPKTPGKLAKKEYPAFDINPLLAKNFLSRLKTWGEAEGPSEQRGFLQEKENHEAVSFQRPNEQYTPWKDVEVEEEKPQTADDRPTTWAEALRRKQNLANGTGTNPQVQKGPAKPKLVAKSAGSEPSPWKIKKDAPKISAKDVPGNLRPLMSCALWRLHESIDRNDANELFLLTDQAEIRKVAQKLNIIVKSTEELGSLVTAKAKSLDLEVSGDLEREFDVPRKAPKQFSLGPALGNGDIRSFGKATDVGAKHEGDRNGTRSGEEEAMEDDNHVTSEETRSVTIRPSGGSKHGESLQNEDQETRVVNILNGSIKTEDKVLATSAINVHSRGADIEPRPLSNGHSPGLLLFNGPTSSTDSTKEVISPSTSTTGNQDEAIAKVVAATRSSPPGHVAESNQPKSGSKGPTQDSSSAEKAAVPAASQQLEAAQEPEDSDEEVVVFVPQPKRFSNQKKQVQQQNSRPSTPNTQPHKQIFDHSSRSPPVTVEAHPKPPSRGRNPAITSHGHPQPTNAPVVIDPDAFGRSFAVNPSPGPRNVRKPRSHHRLRRSAENTRYSQGSQNPTQQNSRASPARQLFHDRSPRLSPAPEPKPARLQSTHSHPIQRTSSQKESRTMESEDVTHQERELHVIKPVAQSQPKSLNARMVESEEFVPRSAFVESQYGAIGTQPNKVEAQDPAFVATNSARKPRPTAPEVRLVDPNSFVPRDFEPITYNKPRAIQARATDPKDFVPRYPTPKLHPVRPAPEPEIIEPRASMPDVEYVLKSGSTRAATRGRGRLWTP